MEQKLDMKGGGRLTLRWDGPRVCMEAERPSDGRGIYKVWARGKQGSGLLLGTLVPEGTMLRLKRTLSQGELARAGCWPLEYAEAQLAFAFSKGEGWYRENHPERMVCDPVLRSQVKGAMLCCRGKEGFRLAAPFRTDGPLALSSLFCLAWVEPLEGKPHLMWQFDREGMPQMPHKKVEAGKDYPPGTGRAPGS